ncbi:hypothetical protein EXU48_21345 [Occultella glacieicola]|uniref:Uncharacterized protein n=1 Tax=Occultella glacieicola TaxID=2518684 RepID=A0ABY2E355_9MICO|nr:hypothetical protein [Occultella glacieicola]TDE89267.1 hypothetical protein EXU48_21345 [Occultella glacieicola]
MNLTDLLAGTARESVPEPEPFAEHLGAIRRRVRRRRAVSRAGSVAVGTLCVAGLVAAGVLTWQNSRPNWVLGPVPDAFTACGLSAPDAVDLPQAVIEADSWLAASSPTVASGDGPRIDLITHLTNIGDTDVTTPAAGADVLLLDPDTQLVVGVGRSDAGAEAAGTADLPVGGAASVIARVSLVSCGAGDVARGAPMPDGLYHVAATDTVSIPGPGAPGGTGDGGGSPGADVPVASWLAGGPPLLISGGVATLPAANGEDPATDPAQEGEATSEPPDGAGAVGFLPECGAMIPAAAENPLWLTVGTDPGPHLPSATDTDAGPGSSRGVTLDLEFGSLADVPLGGMMGEVTTVITDLDGVVVEYWTAGGDLPYEIAADGRLTISGAAWHPLTATCTGDPDGPIADGDYRLFVGLGLSFYGEDLGNEGMAHPATSTLVSAPLDVTVEGGAMTVTAGLD